MWVSFNLTDILALSLPLTNSKKPNQQTNKNQLYILHMPTPLHFLFSAHNHSFEKMVSFSPSQQLITPSTTPQWYRNLTIHISCSYLMTGVSYKQFTVANCAGLKKIYGLAHSFIPHSLQYTQSFLLTNHQFYFQCVSSHVHKRTDS